MERVKVIGLALLLMVVLIGCGNGNDDVVGPNGEENGIPSNGDLPEPVEDLEPMFEPGEVAATGIGDIEAIKVWDLETGEVIHNLEGGIGTRIEFSPCGSRILDASATQEIWDLENEEVITEFEEHDERVWAAAYSPCGSIAVTQCEHYLYMWEVETGEVIKEIGLEDASYARVADFSPTGDKFLYVNSLKEVFIRDRNGEMLLTFEEHEGSVTRAAAFSYCGEKVITGCTRDKVLIWDPETGEVLHEFDHGDDVTSVALSPCGELAASGGRDNKAKVWEVETGEIVSIFDKHERSVEKIEFTPCGEKILSLRFEPIRPGAVPMLWEVETGELLLEFDEHTDSCQGMAIYQGLPGEQ